MRLLNDLSARYVSRVICVLLAISLSFLMVPAAAWASSEQNAGDENEAISAAGVAFESDDSAANAAPENNDPAAGVNLQTIEPMAALYSASASESDIEEGFYTISSAIDRGYVWDISGGSLSDGGNLQLWAANGTNAQLFYISHAGDHYIITAASGKVLDAAGAGLANGTNIQQYATNGTDAQKWSIKANAGGTYTFVNKVNGLAADVTAGAVGSGANLQCYAQNGNDAQKFILSKKVDLLQEGTYKIKSALNGAKVIDVSGGSRNDGANVQLYDDNSSQAQKWSVEKVAGKQNTYALRSLISGRFLTLDPNGNVCQRARTSDGSQYWTISISFGRDVLTNVKHGIALDVLDASTLNGTNIQGHTHNGNAAQLFAFEPTPLLANGTYVIRSASIPNQVLDVSEGSVSDHANVQSWESNDTGAQKWNIALQGDGTYRITSALSGKSIDVQDARAETGRNVQIYSSCETPAQKWWLRDNGDGTFSFATALDSSMRLSVDGSPTNGVNACIGNANSRFSQSFIFEPTVYIPYVSGDPVLDGYAAQLTSGGDLWQAFVRVSQYAYNRSWDHPSPTADWTTWAPAFARQMYESGHGNCFRYAALFAYCARSLGYDARAVVGSVPARAGGWAPHGWVIINENGTEYLYDPDMYKAYPTRNWFRVTYATAPLDYRPGMY